MTVDCRVLASVEGMKSSFNSVWTIRVRTPPVNENPLTHDPSGRIREVHAIRVHMVRPTANT
jgi:hypothetical protein